MQPEISLDRSIVSANARAWRTAAGVPLYAVVKAQAYGWGIARIAPALEEIADAYCVSDADELATLRRYSRKRAIVLGCVPPDRFAEVLRSEGSPTITSPIEFEIAREILRGMGAPLRVRIGIRPAALWSGSTLEELRAFAPGLAAAGAQVEVWSHITAESMGALQAQALKQAVTMMREIGVNVAGTDLASMMPLAAGGPQGTAVRVGIGLFGATGGPTVNGVRCALRVVAPVTRVHAQPAGTQLGYGGRMLRMEETIATARCGYADGLPNTLEGSDDILSIGMQYTTVRASRCSPDHSELVLLDESSNLDAFAARAGRLPHEIVTAFGNCARANGVSVEV